MKTLLIIDNCEACKFYLLDLTEEQVAEIAPDQELLLNESDEPEWLLIGRCGINMAGDEVPGKWETIEPFDLDLDPKSIDKIVNLTEVL